MAVLLLSEQDVGELLTMKDVLDVCDKTFINWGEGKVVCPAKLTLELGEDAEWPPYRNGLNAMPAYIDWQKSAGIKCVGGSLNNPANGLPYIIAMILLFDPETGVFRAIMDGERITNYRTGGQAAVAAKYLVPENSFELGIVGAGAQGRTQMLAFSEMFALKGVRIYDIDPSACEKFVRDMAEQTGVSIRVCKSVQEAAEADVLISVTHGRDKFIKKEWIHPGQLVMPMGSFTECDDEILLSADRVVVDSIGQTMHRGALKSVVDAGKFGEKDISATIAEIAAGKKSGKMALDERVVCIPIGTGAMDVTCATLVYERAKEREMGTYHKFASCD